MVLDHLIFEHVLLSASPSQPSLGTLWPFPIKIQVSLVFSIFLPTPVCPHFSVDLFIWGRWDIRNYWEWDGSPCLICLFGWAEVSITAPYQGHEHDMNPLPGSLLQESGLWWQHLWRRKLRGWMRWQRAPSYWSSGSEVNHFQKRDDLLVSYMFQEPRTSFNYCLIISCLQFLPLNLGCFKRAQHAGVRGWGAGSMLWPQEEVRGTTGCMSRACLCSVQPAAVTCGRLGPCCGLQCPPSELGHSEE